MSGLDFNSLNRALGEINPLTFYGRVSQIVGLTIESIGPAAQMGEVCRIYSSDESTFCKAEVVGFRENKVLLMPFGSLTGIGAGCKVDATGEKLTVPVGDGFLGRVLDGLGNPMDGLPPPVPMDYYPLENHPPNPLDRSRIEKPISLGVKAIDGLITCGIGQRMGIFAGSGVGKSTLMGMIAKSALTDVNVITLIGERGREVREFIEKDLGKEGLKRSILIIATSDQPALVRIKSALTGTAIAEYFRDRGMNVLLMMDSITRFAMAQREIGMAVGEPPVSRGYTPSVFTVLPRLLERSGNSSNGSITALYTVLVEGDDLNEPVTDAVRGILDGHMVLSRDLANRNHYPAIDVLASVSRLMPDITSPEHYKLAGHLRSRMAIYRDAQDLINIGAYKKGSNPEIDDAIDLNASLSGFLQQSTAEIYNLDKTLEEMFALRKAKS